MQTSMAERRPSLKSDPLLDREVAKCKVLEQIGRGGMGVVYRARHRTLQKQMALKVLAIDSGITQQQLEQFFVEARAQASIDHVNVVQVYDVDRFENWFYILMQYIDGPSLSDAMTACGPLPWPAAARVAAAAARGLAAAHMATPAFIHQDVKPSNILIGPDWEAKVLDFGLTTLLEADENAVHQIAGTAHYVPPEIVQGKPPSPVSDLYSLGITLFEALTNRRVFSGRNRTEVIKARLHQEAPPLAASLPEQAQHVPDELCDMVARLLSRDPKKRPESALVVADQLEQILEFNEHTLPDVPTKQVKSPKADTTAQPTPADQHPSPRRIEQWAQRGMTLYSCKKCATSFLRGGHVEGHIVLCPSCNSKLTVPDKESLAQLQIAQRSKASADESATSTASAELELQGPSEPILTEKIAQESRETDPPDPAARLHLPPAFLGRDWLIGKVTEAVRNDTRLIQLQGGSGLGKSRFLNEAAKHFSDLCLLRAGAERRGRPLAPFDELTAQTLEFLARHEPGQLDALVDQHGSWLLQISGPLTGVGPLKGVQPQAQLRPKRQLEAFNAMFEMLLGTSQVALVVDDAERCGDNSDSCWEVVLRLAHEHPLSILLTHGEPLPNPLSERLAALPSESFTLEPLPEGLLPPFFTSIFGLAQYPKTLCDAINYVAQGIPADLVDIVHNSVASELLEDSDSGWSWAPEYQERLALRLPERIDQRLAQTAAKLPPMHQEVLGVLARIGCSLRPAQLVEAGGFPADKLSFILNDLVKNRILLKPEDRYSFVSEGLRTMLADAVPPEKRADLHARIARILEQDTVDSDPPQADILAIHLEEAGDPLRAIHFRIVAARGFARQGSYSRSRESYENALALLDQFSPRKTSGLFPRLRRKHDCPDPLAVQTELANIHCRMGQSHLAIQMLKTGLQSAHGRGDQTLVGQFERGLALARARSAAPEALTHFSRIEEVSELVDAHLLAEISHLYLIRDNHSKARSLLDKALALPDPEPADRLGVLLGLARLELRLGHWKVACERVDEALDSIPEGHLRQTFRPRLLLIQARSLCRSGKLREASKRLDAARRYQTSSMEAELEVRLTQSELLLASGLAEPAVKAAQAMRRRAVEAKRPYDEAWALIHQGEAEMPDPWFVASEPVHHACPRQARESLSLALKRFELLKSPFGRARAYIGLAQCYGSVGNPDRARALLDFASKNLKAAKLTWPRARLALAQSHLAELEGDTQMALKYLDKADEIAESTHQERLLQIVRERKSKLENHIKQ